MNDVNDDVFILGDVSFGSEQNTYDTLQMMNGKKHLIIGNHDHNIYKSKRLSSCFASMQNYKEITVDTTRLVLFHYPIESWNRWRHGAIHLHGHMHGRFGDDNLKNRMDVGVDNRKDKLMIPFTLDEILIRVGEKQNNTDYIFRVEVNR
jgi:calcineurin-like phosphoesterase family protein